MLAFLDEKEDSDWLEFRSLLVGGCDKLTDKSMKPILGRLPLFFPIEFMPKHSFA